MDNVRPKSCPVCNGDRINTKRIVVRKYEYGEDSVQVWAYCLNCGHRGLNVYGRMSEAEGKTAAIRQWNVG